MSAPASPEPTSYRRWTPDELEVLRSSWGSMSAAEIGAQVGRTAGAVSHQATRMGLPPRRRRWSEAELRVVTGYTGPRRGSDIPRLLGRSEEAVGKQVTRLGALRAPRWSTSDLAYLRHAWPMQSIEEIAAHLGRTRSAVQARARRLGLDLKRPAPEAWMAKELTYLEEQWGQRAAAEIAVELGRTAAAVRERALMIGLSRYRVLSPEAEELLWEMRGTPGVVEYFAEHFGKRPAAIQRVLRRLEEQGGPGAEAFS